MKNLLVSLFVFCLLLIAADLRAQELTITKEDVTRYVESIGPYINKMKEIQQVMQDGEPTVEEINEAQMELKEVLTSYGWGDEYDDKSKAIMQLHALISAQMEAKASTDAYLQERIDALKSEEDKYAERYGMQSITNVKEQHEKLTEVLETLM